MRYKHTKEFAIHQIEKLQAIVAELIDENNKIASGEFKGYKTDIYQHSDKWLRDKHKENMQRIESCERTIIDYKNKYCINN